MHIPYSMDESETDLYGGYGGARVDIQHDPSDALPPSYETLKMVREVSLKYLAEEKRYTQADMDAAVAKAYQDGYDNASLWS